ncbi:MAG TPA: biopolymer transporter ExbD [Bacteroidota bacterium]|nr:biopolymer transporter ExbD [Bacteroidota bacterium]
MPKHKKARVGFRIDMTPMVDVAMLLLTFFMLATSFKPPEEVTVALPQSHSAFKVPDADVMTITVTKEGKTWLGVDNQGLMARLFGPAARYKMAVEVANKSDLGNILIQARISNPRLRTVVKGDKQAPFGPIEDVMDILQKTQITRFNLVTEFDKG